LKLFEGIVVSTPRVLWRAQLLSKVSYCTAIKQNTPMLIGITVVVCQGIEVAGWQLAKARLKSWKLQVCT
jgi:hypothetical protein